jgi:hypothetical protein
VSQDLDLVQRHAAQRISIRTRNARYSADEHAQTNESPNMATATPSARRGPRRRGSSTPGCPSWAHSHPPPLSVLPESAARKILVWRAHIPDTYAASAPNQQPGRIRGSASARLPGDGGYATPVACRVSTISWRHGLRRTCRLGTGRSHRPRSTWPDQDRLACPAVTHRYKRTHCLWLEQFQIAESARSTAAW